MEVDVMTVRKYLEQYGEAVRIAERLKTEYDQELLEIDNVRSTLGGDGTPHGTGISRATEDKAIRLADKALELKDAELEAVRIRQEVFDSIRRIQGTKGDILYEKYINLKSWDEVADTVGYSKRHVQRLHDEALPQVQIPKNVILCHPHS
jgi:DNA-directed RNA polymerase specialized sigma subunit